MLWWCETGNALPVKGFGVQCLETRCLSADLVFRIWERCVKGYVISVRKRYACQRICSSNFETLRVSANLVLRGWKHYACQSI